MFLKLKEFGGISFIPEESVLCAVSVLVVAQSSSEIPEGLMNNPVYTCSSLGSSDGVLCSESLPLDFTHRRLVITTCF